MTVVTKKELPKVGDVVRFLGASHCGLTEGKEYIIEATAVDYYGNGDLESVKFTDDFGDDEVIDGSNLHYFNVTDAPLTEIDIMANLARRLSELEDEQERMDADDMQAVLDYATSTTTDATSPEHYKQGGVEVIDIIRQATDGADGFEGLCLGNVIKYVMRYRHKNGVEDLRKAAVYLEWLIEEVEAIK